MGEKNISWSRSSATSLVSWFALRTWNSSSAINDDNDVFFADDAGNFFASVIPALVRMRDARVLTLDGHALWDVAHIEKYLEVMRRPEIGATAAKAMAAYLETIPSNSTERGYLQNEAVDLHFARIRLGMARMRGEFEELDAPVAKGSGHWRDRMSAAFLKGRRWLAHQAREMWREIKRAARPPVTVRLHGKQVLAISTRPEFGGGLVLMPLSGNCGVVAAAWSETVSANAPKAFGVEVWNDAAAGERQIWPVGEFPDRATAEEVVERIRKPLTGSTWGKWVFRAAVLWIALIAVRAWFNAPAPQGAGAQAATASAVPGSALLQLMGPGGMGGSDSPSLAALAGDAGGGASGGGSLADDIYKEAMAAQRQSMHEQGPPQTPSPDIDLKSFGLAGGKNGEGCDPKLAFKVEP